MSSPTINVLEGSGDTSLLTICNLVRAIINDSQAGATSTVGEGQIFVDDSGIAAFVQPLLNSSIRSLYRQLRLVGDPALIKDNVIVTGLTPINSPLYGLASPDSAVQTFLSFEGYFDGLTINSNITLPSDVIAIERIWERATGTTNLFVPMVQPQFGLPSCLQGPCLSIWEWRQQRINMVGATQTRDLRLRYYCALPQFFSSTLDFASTYVPIIDCTDAVAYMTAYKYAMMLGSPNTKDIQAQALEEMRQLKMSHVRRAQSVDYHKIGYHEGNGHYGWGAGNSFGWW